MSFFDLTFKFHLLSFLGNHSFDFVPKVVFVVTQGTNISASWAFGTMWAIAGQDITEASFNTGSAYNYCAFSGKTFSWYNNQQSEYRQFNVSGSLYAYCAVG